MNCLYIHIPFCLRKCHYCAFNSTVASTDLHQRYLSALRLELQRLAGLNQEIISTLFIGGGTPTCLAAEKLCSLVEFCGEEFGFSKRAEISVEANPGTVDGYYFEQLFKAGVNRLSLGVQSFDNRELQAIGRVHDKTEALEACRTAREAGFTNINLDLMYGLPHQTKESWKNSLALAFDLGVQHLSLYQLMVEEGTVLGRQDEAGELVLPQEEVILEMDSVTASMSRDHGFHQYETSNYSLAGFECRHNINYWENGDYQAAGAGAVSYHEGRRERREVEPESYISAIETSGLAIIESELLDREASFRETVIMGLRMTRGVSLDSLQNRYKLHPSDYYGELLDTLIANGLVEITPDHLRITEKGWPLSNLIMAELV